jgi:hypothetical protein
VICRPVNEPDLAAGALTSRQRITSSARLSFRVVVIFNLRHAYLESRVSLQDVDETVQKTEFSASLQVVLHRRTSRTCTKKLVFCEY